MNSWYLTSSALIVCASAIHSGLGEYLILTRMNSDHLPTTPFGGKSMTFQLLRGSWHLVSAAWLALAAALAIYAQTPEDPRGSGIALLVAVLFALLGLGMILRDPRMLLRHPAPALFLAIAATAWLGCS
jgi:hypothetical protein